jgi:hypothetical protein
MQRIKPGRQVPPGLGLRHGESAEFTLLALRIGKEEACFTSPVTRRLRRIQFGVNGGLDCRLEENGSHDAPCKWYYLKLDWTVLGNRRHAPPHAGGKRSNQDAKMPDARALVPSPLAVHRTVTQIEGEPHPLTCDGIPPLADAYTWAAWRSVTPRGKVGARRCGLLHAVEDLRKIHGVVVKAGEAVGQIRVAVPAVFRAITVLDFTLVGWIRR